HPSPSCPSTRTATNTLGFNNGLSVFFNARAVTTYMPRGASLVRFSRLFAASTWMPPCWMSVPHVPDGTVHVSPGNMGVPVYRIDPAANPDVLAGVTAPVWMWLDWTADAASFDGPTALFSRR